MTRPVLHDAVPSRLLTAEATAAAALALIQRPALWEAISTLALLIETTELRASEHVTTLGAELLAIIGESAITTAEAEEAASLLDLVDKAARTWAAISHRETGTDPTEQARAHAPRVQEARGAP